MANTTLGFLQIQPLLILADAGEALSTPELGRRMAAATGRPPYKSGALATMLNRLEDDGLVRSTHDATAQGLPGRPARLYELLPAGRERLNDQIGQIRRLMAIADRVSGLAA